MRTGKPPINSRLGKPTVLKLVFQGAEGEMLERFRKQHGRSQPHKTFPMWIKDAACAELRRRERAQALDVVLEAFASEYAISVHRLLGFDTAARLAEARAARKTSSTT